MKIPTLKEQMFGDINKELNEIRNRMNDEIRKQCLEILKEKNKKEKHWNFKSESKPGVIYTVQELDNRLICNCPSFAFSKDKICRHTNLVKNDLAGIAVHQEPVLVPAYVRKVIKDGNRVLVPLVDNELERLKFIYQLRKFGVSKKTCIEYFNLDYGSDRKMEDRLRQTGYFKKKVTKVPAFALLRC